MDFVESQRANKLSDMAFKKVYRKKTVQPAEK